jgi:hypothetical protein
VRRAPLGEMSEMLRQPRPPSNGLRRPYISKWIITGNFLRSSGNRGVHPWTSADCSGRLRCDFCYLSETLLLSKLDFREALSACRQAPPGPRCCLRSGCSWPTQNIESRWWLLNWFTCYVTRAARKAHRERSDLKPPESSTDPGEGSVPQRPGCAREASQPPGWTRPSRSQPSPRACRVRFRLVAGLATDTRAPGSVVVNLATGLGLERGLMFCGPRLAFCFGLDL